VLQELSRRGYELGMASNYDGRLRRVAAGFPDLRPVRHVVISSEVGWRKPAREFFAALGKAVGVAAGQTMFVGDDRGNDYEGARAAGLGAVLYDANAGAASAGVARIARLRELLSGREPASSLHGRR
jgi:putative hydrolase of the HAD superfamily